MPTRMLKESIWTSPNLNRCSQEAQSHFFKLLPATDDYGCFEATPEVVKGKCYSLMPDISVAMIVEWTNELLDNGLILIWEIGERKYAEMVKFSSHQDIEEKHKPKTPPAPWHNPLDRLHYRSRQAFNKVSVAIKSIESEGRQATNKEILLHIECSESTIAKYRKFLKEHDLTTDDYTNYTCYTPNPIPNLTHIPYPNHSKEKRENQPADILPQNAAKEKKKKPPPEIEWGFELDIVELFEQKFPTVSKLRNPLTSKVGLKTLASIRARAKEEKWGKEVGPWSDLFDRVLPNDWLINRNFFGIEWISLPTNFEKCMNGKHDGDKNKVGSRGNGYSRDKLTDAERKRFMDAQNLTGGNDGEKKDDIPT